MELTEQLKDWTFRYQYIYRLRRTNKQKKRFLSALVMDITKMRDDIQVIEYQRDKKYMASNLYVGAIEQADTVICTYYDTSSKSLGDHELFDRSKQRKAVTNFILISSFLSLLVGLLLTMLYIKQAESVFDFTSSKTLLVIACYVLYFYLFSKVSKGLTNRCNLIRNTSSVLSLLTLIASIRNKKVAFAFVDEGCVGERGFDVLRSSCKATAKIYALDCVGANTDLHFMGRDFDQYKGPLEPVKSQSEDRLNRIFGSHVRQTSQGNMYYLTQADLKKKELCHENLETILSIFK